jgi:hypothetical protein
MSGFAELRARADPQWSQQSTSHSLLLSQPLSSSYGSYISSSSSSEAVAVPLSVPSGSLSLTLSSSGLLQDVIEETSASSSVNVNTATAAIQSVPARNKTTFSTVVKVFFKSDFYLSLFQFFNSLTCLLHTFVIIRMKYFSCLTIISACM